MSETSAFVPVLATVSIAATSVSANVALGSGASGVQARIYNSGGVVVFINWGFASSLAATTSGLPIAPGSVEVLSFPQGTTYVAAITSTGSATIYFTQGQGV